jgi:outer membrane receptor protein involved in Fe transport
MGLDPALSPDALVQAPAFSDLGIGAEYRFYKRFSLFLEANNLAAQSYERWYSYPERPLDFRGGLSVVF